MPIVPPVTGTDVKKKVLGALDWIRDVNIEAYKKTGMTQEQAEQWYDNPGDVLDIKDFTDEEIDEFVNSIPSDAFNKMQEFFNGMPAVTLDVDYKVGKKKKTKTLRGIADFFS